MFKLKMKTVKYLILLFFLIKPLFSSNNTPTQKLKILAQIFEGNYISSGISINNKLDFLIGCGSANKTLTLGTSVKVKSIFLNANKFSLALLFSSSITTDFNLLYPAIGAGGSIIFYQTKKINFYIDTIVFYEFLQSKNIFPKLGLGIFFEI